MTTIITKNGSGAPSAGQLSQGELAVDLTNKELYSKDSGNNVVKIGAVTSGGSTGTFTDLTATNSLAVTGNTTATGDLDITGDVDITGTTTATGNVDVTGDLNITGTTSVAEMIEKVTINASTTGAISFDFLTQAVQFFTTNQTANRTIDFRGDGSNSLDSVMAVGESMTAAVLMTQGTTAYYLNTYQIDGSAVTPEWSGGSAPSAGSASSIDAYVFTIIKTASATFTVLASQSRYA